jgi:hypothetical protein
LDAEAGAIFSHFKKKKDNDRSRKKNSLT